jgi:hypothetical protein
MCNLHARIAIVIGAFLLATCCCSDARGEHAKIQLDVASGGKSVSAFVDQTPPEWGKNPRPVLRVPRDQAIKVQWILTNIYPHKTLEDVVVHAFVVRQDRAGQKEIPAITEDVVIESAYEIDMKPGSKSGARFTLRIPEPGAYLLRVETKNTQSDHEHFAAVDLVVEP